MSRFSGSVEQIGAQTVRFQMELPPFEQGQGTHIIHSWAQNNLFLTVHSTMGQISSPPQKKEQVLKNNNK